MGTPSPELKQLWIRVLKRVHPDLAVDEPDRIRCERLTQSANEAYQAGNVEALRAVLGPSQSPSAAATRVYAGSSFAMNPLLPVAIGAVILIWGGFSLYSSTASPPVVTNSAPAQVDIQARIEVPDAVIWQIRPSKSHGDLIPNQISQDLGPSTVAGTIIGTSGEDQPTKVSLFTTSGLPYPLQDRQRDSVEPSQLYMEQMRERLHQSFNNYERVDANVPPGNSSETWFNVNRDGSVSNVRVGKPSGWASLDYACVRAVQRAETVGALPEDYKLPTLPATFACSYNGSNALQTSRTVDSATVPPDLYVGSVRNTTHP